MSKTLFEHINAIYLNQSPTYFDDLEDADKKSFSTYMVNRFLSMNPDYVPLVNELQMYYENIGSREAYLFYSNVIPKKRQFYKYIKASKGGSYVEWLVNLVAKHFMVSTTEADGYITLYLKSDEGRDALKAVCELYGVEPKDIARI